MKRIFGLLFFVALGAAFWVSQGTQQPLLRELAQQAKTVSRQASENFSTQLQAAKAPEPTGQQLSKYEKILCDLANQERRKRGLSALKITPALADVARGHSQEMMQKNYFSHTSPTAARRSLLDRYKLKYKRDPRFVAENIYMLKTSGNYTLTESDFRRAHTGWMNSPGHRANILRTEPLSPAQIGVGIIVKNGSFWATQNFATPQ